MTRVCEDVAEAIAVCTVGAVDVLLTSGRELLPPVANRLMRSSRYPQTALVLLDDKPRTENIITGLLEVEPNISMIELEPLVLRTLRELTHPARSDTGNLAPNGTETDDAAGKIVCFWGAPGSPGRTIVALNYAVEAALAGQSVVMLDADTFRCLDFDTTGIIR